MKNKQKYELYLAITQCFMVTGIIWCLYFLSESLK